ncbi:MULTISPECIES: non-hydrolyzing UDP-N-acetylglucosamine 2-epimerase [Cupriavidus]|uniref:UDP-N-acetylglucosamine 2-epimerase (non-hydrolyzing) n=1 Tax=Cupriavidus pinatubonensis (strain JMP 134 / LMG 1197) TaxID=264198 RepID=Q46RD6_CUPPJ|nr:MULTISPECIES: UDP-N-acetylglucosamine 2-epimerase (non-hydrolyzing) [Cupriavidus]TPQ36761.1 UDP-N-acetylglucosamine 2-epimerase (non-hydrolyzing) [Cupriavidus pinatubonensis]
MKILSVFGTRPEAIKMAPLVKTLGGSAEIDSVVCVTGQHQQMLQQVLDLFDIVPQYNLELMTRNQTLNGLSSRLLASFDDVLETVRPDRILVHGDTTSAMVSALAAFHRRIPVGHVEAGLRTGDLSQPWPEEMNRRTIDVCADLLFAPTESSRHNLQAENLGGRIVVTGNTVIDALLQTTGRILADQPFRERLDAHFPFLRDDRKLLLVTGHRRENFGTGFANICEALAQLARRDDIQIVYPVHLNPNVQGPVQDKLSGLPNVHLIEPLDYALFVRLMQRAHVILTDSGGVQEEAPSLGKPVLVMRNVTERPEAVHAGTVRLVGTEVASIVHSVTHLYDNDDAWRAFSQRLNPYGDGHASQRIVAALTGAPMGEFLHDQQAAA